MSNRVVRFSREQAVEAAKAEVRQQNEQAGSSWPPDVELEVLEDLVYELWWAWVIPFSTVKYVRTRRLEDAPLGPGPILVDKFNGELLHTGSRFEPMSGAWSASEAIGRGGSSGADTISGCLPDDETVNAQIVRDEQGGARFHDSDDIRSAGG